MHTSEYRNVLMFSELIVERLAREGVATRALVRDIYEAVRALQVDM